MEFAINVRVKVKCKSFLNHLNAKKKKCKRHTDLLIVIAVFLHPLQPHYTYYLFWYHYNSTKEPRYVCQKSSIWTMWPLSKPSSGLLCPLDLVSKLFSALKPNMASEVVSSSSNTVSKGVYLWRKRWSKRQKLLRMRSHGNSVRGGIGHRLLDYELGEIVLRKGLDRRWILLPSFWTALCPTWDIEGVQI